ncbi:TetR/AcrR family transcriptional regulator [Dictyobacter aurantiacus]|uniref:Putative transcriptional regulator, TetR family protein n=1 Tax=Dictyobacter aurantiacus TaxID=1936993 RepID=A0A401ZMI2_9CHLR|nr:TetR/AcrR family transcriptional regulator [Dictyobacter aurantiacus]GCE08052.1 putative transcriptional regulator, TetR family protein [Dictyobacter aurantiacus]
MVKLEPISARRAAIIEAALRVLARDGIAETTTRKIAAEAQVNQAMLRYYFGSKDDLLFAVLQTLMQQTGEIVGSVGFEGRTLPEAIAHGLRAFWSHVESYPEQQIIQYELTLYALRHPESAWLARQQYDGYCAVVEALFEKAMQDTEQTCAIPATELARFVVAGIDGLILQFISDRDTVRARRDLEHLIASVTLLALHSTGQPS